MEMVYLLLRAAGRPVSECSGWLACSTVLQLNTSQNLHHERRLNSQHLKHVYRSSTLGMIMNTFQGLLPQEADPSQQKRLSFRCTTLHLVTVQFRSLQKPECPSLLCSSLFNGPVCKSCCRAQLPIRNNEMHFMTSKEVSCRNQGKFNGVPVLQ
jgi:hypothetical protein